MKELLQRADEIYNSWHDEDDDNFSIGYYCEVTDMAQIMAIIKDLSTALRERVKIK